MVITDGPPSNKDTFPVLPEAAKWDEISDIIVIAISNEIKLEGYKRKNWMEGIDIWEETGPTDTSA